RRLTELAAHPDPPIEMFTTQAWLAALLNEPELAREAANRAGEAREPRTRLLAEAYADAASGQWPSAADKFEQVTAERSFNCCAATWRGLAAIALDEPVRAAEFLREANSYSDCKCAARERLQAAVTEPPTW